MDRRRLLQSCVSATKKDEEGEEGEKEEEEQDEKDAKIKQLRNTIFKLKPPDQRAGALVEVRFTEKSVKSKSQNDVEMSKKHYFFKSRVNLLDLIKMR